MDYPFQAYGTLTYDANRGSLKKRTGWWLTVELDDEEIPRYYRWWVDRQWWDADSKSFKRNYHKPPHWPHISVIRGEKPRKNISHWGKYLAGKRVRFFYSPDIRQTSNAFYADEPDKFWFIDTQWDGYTELRKHYGLKWQYQGRPFRGHVTVARTYD